MLPTTQRSLSQHCQHNGCGANELNQGHCEGHDDPALFAHTPPRCVTDSTAEDIEDPFLLQNVIKYGPKGVMGA